LKRAKSALAVRARAAGVDLDHHLRCEQETALLLDTLSAEQREAVLSDLDEGAGNPREDLTSAVSSALIAVNAFGAFIGRRHSDELLKLTLSSPRFERKYPVSGVRTWPERVPNLDVVQVDGDRAVAIESKLAEPWRGKPRFRLSSQYDEPAECFSAALREEMNAVRAAHYELFDAAQAVKHLLGLHSAVKRDPAKSGPRLPKQTTLVLLHWEPEHATDEPLIGALHDEAEAFRDRIAGGPIAVQLLSYPRLWRTWQAEGQPSWLRAHADALADRYQVGLGESVIGTGLQ
jgi:hypothetical protein